jgi:hypothetical protein
MTTGDIYTIAGNGTQTFTRPANGTVARSNPIEPLFSYAWTGTDKFGDLVFSSGYNNRDVFMVAGQSCSSACPYGFSSMTAGDIYWLAGNDFAGGPTDGGNDNGDPATQALFETPTGFAVDSAHDLLIADSGTDEIRLVAGFNCSSSCPFGLPSMTAGDVYSLDSFNGSPEQLSLDPFGNLIVGDPLNFNVGVIPTSNCSSSCPYGLPSMIAGDLYILEGVGASTTPMHAPRAHAASATIAQPSGMTFDPTGTLFVQDESSNTVDAVHMAAPSSSAPGGGGPAPPQLTINSFKLAHSHGHAGATLSLTCANAACVGAASLTETVRVKVHHAHHRSTTQTQTVTLGVASYSFNDGESGTVTLTLTKRGRNAISHATHKHPLNATVTLTVNGGASVTQSARAT